MVKASTSHIMNFKNFLLRVCTGQIFKVGPPVIRSEPLVYQTRLVVNK